MSKKLILNFILICILSSITLNAYSNEISEIKSIEKYNPVRPEWNEFCPYGMENPVTDNNFHMPGTKKAWHAEESNYWYKRKQNFERDLSFCDSVEKDVQNACYEKLRFRQHQISSSYISPEQRWEQTRLNLNQASNAINQYTRQQQQLNMQRQNMMMQNMPKWSDYQPKTYNVNIRHY